MNKSTILILLILTLLLTACAANGASTTDRASATQGGAPTAELSVSMQVAIGTIKLDETENAVTAEQAAELLPLWQTLEVLYASDTAATEEIDALITQIQDSMTDQQTQAIGALNLSRQDMMSIMQEQGMMMGGGQAGNPQTGNSTNNGGGGFGPGGGGFAGGPPPDERLGAGAPNFQGQPQQSTNAADTTARATTIDPSRIPTPLVNAVIEYLKEKAGS